MDALQPVNALEETFRLHSHLTAFGHDSRDLVSQRANCHPRYHHQECRALALLLLAARLFASLHILGSCNSPKSKAEFMNPPPALGDRSGVEKLATSSCVDVTRASHGRGSHVLDALEAPLLL